MKSILCSPFLDFCFFLHHWAWCALKQSNRKHTISISPNPCPPPRTGCSFLRLLKRNEKHRWLVLQEASECLLETRKFMLYLCYCKIRIIV